MRETIDTVVIGAGLAGLLAARELVDAGRTVTVVDKSFAPGGRLASKRVGDARFDIGAQFLTVRDERFAGHVDRWRSAGVVEVAWHGSPDLEAADDTEGHPRLRGTPTMRTIAEHLAGQLPVRLATRVTALHRGQRWRIEVADRDERPLDDLVADTVVLTAPVPQALALLEASEVELDADVGRRLGGVDFDPTLTVLAVPEATPRLPARGVVRLDGDPVAWITDDHAVGASPTPALTIHLGGDVSRAWWSRSDEDIGTDALAAAEPHLGVPARTVHVHRWRYSWPTADVGAPALYDETGATLVIAGDGCAGGRVEGAATSGLAAADLLLGAR